MKPGVTVGILASLAVLAGALPPPPSAKRGGRQVRKMPGRQARKMPGSSQVPLWGCC